jgi:hypothetical protein
MVDGRFLIFAGESVTLPGGLFFVWMKMLRSPIGSVIAVLPPREGNP